MPDVSEQSIVEIHQRDVPAEPHARPAKGHSKIKAGRALRRVLVRLSAGLALATALVTAVAAASVQHFVLALSWSPTFCASPESSDDALQCGEGHPFSFVVHGLWPQAGKGSLAYCHSRETWVPEEQIAEMLPIMPSKQLIIHEWRKHGTCSGLSMEEYFDLIERLFDRVNVPARYLSSRVPISTTPSELVSDFAKSNRGLRPEMLEVVCSSRARRSTLRELRLCFSMAGEFVQCRSKARAHCRAETLVLPPVTDN
jgi:ribonuclease T2